MKEINLNQLKLVTGGAEATNSENANSIALKLSGAAFVLRAGLSIAESYLPGSRTYIFGSMVTNLCVTVVLSYPLTYLSSKLILDVVKPEN